MSDSISAAAANAGGTPAVFPAKRKILLELEVEVKDQDTLDYFFDPSSISGQLQIGYIADLFDLFNFQYDHGILSINGIGADEIRRRMGLLL